MSNSDLKIYIVIKESAPSGIAVNSVAHASLIAHLKWEKEELYQAWLKNSFKKFSCVVSDEEFNRLKQEYPDCIVVTESKLDHAEICLVIKPSSGDKRLKYLKAWGKV